MESLPIRPQRSQLASEKLKESIGKGRKFSLQQVSNACREDAKHSKPLIGWDWNSK
jgi:hypothetical protein